MLSELVLGSGSNPQKQVLSPLNDSPAFASPVTCDLNTDHAPDVVHDLNVLPWPWADDSFDEIHAYNVLEHLGTQGEFRAFFAQFDEMWRILKPGGYVCGISVDYYSPHLWADPGHTRAITRHMLQSFLSREQYEIRHGKSPLTDYRFCYKGDFEYVPIEQAPEKDQPWPDQFPFLLKVFKPVRFAS